MFGLLRSLFGVFRLRSRAQASAWLLGLATLVLTVWFHCWLAVQALNVNAATLHTALDTVHATGVDTKLADAVGGLFDAGISQVPGAASKDLEALQKQVTKALGAGLSPKLVDALVTTVITTRDQAVTQLESTGPTKTVTVDVGPIVTALGIEIPADLVKTLGVKTPSSLPLPLLDAQLMTTLRWQYGYLGLANTWGWVVAGGLALLGVLLSPRPWRTLGIAFGLGGVLCLVILPLFDWVTGVLLTGDLAAWGALLTPLVEGLLGAVRPWLVPVGIGGIVVAVLLFVLQAVLSRRNDDPHPETSAAVG